MKWANPATVLTEKERLLLEAIRPALAHMALYEAYPYLPLTLDITGVTESRSKDGTMEQVAPGQENKNGQKRALYTDGQFYLNELQEYLEATATASIWPSFYLANQRTSGQDDPEDLSNDSLVIL